jgi:hypothetical protein
LKTRPRGYLREVEYEWKEGQARDMIGQAADVLHYTAHPGDEIGSTSADAPALDPIIRRMNELEDLLGPGIGPASTDDGLPKLRELVRDMESLVMTPAGRGSPVFLTQNARNTLTNAARTLKRVERLYS